ncbi:hypothetical protein SISSUDRAFT_1117534 [Sistotremastrum suecicum HHB10207 ss-3]|uniref:F-box domain-containing protein n=1 Tax=Sistotremastrum suecicum HHB10207 ss-3 TaxID=1314776 RepID=A0A166GD09_9AGAM|nr:hypothetical protein SISSUDRAFT_1117534 [Sistotremastrum suecicum HHB10207 ss-3]
MRFPPELCGKIAQDIRDSDWELHEHAPDIEQWKDENATLYALSLVSKVWRAETIRHLWSGIILSEGIDDVSDGGPSERLISRILASCNASKHNVAPYIRRLYVEGTCNEMEESDVISGICDFLTTCSRIHYLRLEFHAHPRRLMVLRTLSSLRFPHLKTFYLAVAEAENKESEHLSDFLLVHPGIQLLRLEGLSRMLESQFQSLREKCPLPALEKIVTDILSLPILSSSSPVKTIECIPSLSAGSHSAGTGAFIWALSRLAHPLPNVTELVIHRGGFEVDSVVLPGLGHFFPSLQVLDGVSVSELFFKLMGSVDRRVSPSDSFLPKLHTLVMYEIYGRDSKSYIQGVAFATPTDAAIEKAVKALPFHFPAIVSAMYVKEGHESLQITTSKIMTRHFLEDGTVDESQSNT